MPPFKPLCDRNQLNTTPRPQFAMLVLGVNSPSSAPRGPMAWSRDQRAQSMRPQGTYTDSWPSNFLKASFPRCLVFQFIVILLHVQALLLKIHKEGTNSACDQAKESAQVNNSKTSISNSSRNGDYCKILSRSHMGSPAEESHPGWLPQQGSEPIPKILDLK